MTRQLAHLRFRAGLLVSESERDRCVIGDQHGSDRDRRCVGSVFKTQFCNLATKRKPQNVN